MKKFGIDVSLYQKGFDFKRAKGEGVEFVLIKCSENTFTDPQFEAHYASAKQAGLYVGAYHYLRATTKDGAIKEAMYAINNPLKGKQFEYPIFVDIEEPSLKVGKANLTEIVKAFCNTLQNNGYWAGFYTNLDWYRNYLDGASLAKQYTFWCAYWGTSCPCNDAQLWQFGGETNLIRVNKVAGVVCDQDYSFKDFPTLIKERGVNGYGKPTPKPALPGYTGIIIYQAYSGGKWWGEISSANANGTGYNSYAGVIGTPINALKARAQYGKLWISVHYLGGGWSKRYDMSNGASAGTTTKKIDAIKIWSETGHVDFQAHAGGKWWSWIDSRNCDKNDYNSYAGIIGTPIDAIRMK